MAKISVLIPIYNSEKYIEECIKSVINQTYRNIEIICINDGSTDSTKNILENLQKIDNRIKIINKKNTGYGNSLNLGIKNAKGEYIAIIESDDFIKDTMFDKLIKIIKEQNCDIIKANFYKKNSKTKKYSSKYFTNSIQNIEIFPQMLLIQPSVWSAIYKKDFLTKNNIKFSKTKNASYQDISFHFITMFLAKKIFLLDEALYYYRINNPKSSINSSNKPFQIFKEFKRINEFLKNIKTDKKQEEIKNIFEFKTMLWNFNRVQNKYNKILLKKMKKYSANWNFKNLIKNKNLARKEKFYLKLFLNYNVLFNIIYTIRKTIKNYV